MQHNEHCEIDCQPVLPLLGKDQIVQLFEHRLAPWPEEVCVVDALKLRCHDDRHGHLPIVQAVWGVDGMATELLLAADMDRVANQAASHPQPEGVGQQGALFGRLQRTSSQRAVSVGRNETRNGSYLRVPNVTKGHIICLPKQGIQLLDRSIDEVPHVLLDKRLQIAGRFLHIRHGIFRKGDSL